MRHHERVLALLATVAALALPAAAPAPAAPLPTTTTNLAQRLAQTNRVLNEAIEAWRATGVARAPRELHLWALHQQRLYLALGLQPARTHAAVVALLPPRQRPTAREILAARRALVALTPPTKLPTTAFLTGPPAPADELLRHYRDAERRFGVPWNVLAAVNFVESAFGKLRSRSTAGALGPMQFMPATWRAYGLGGNVHEPRDAIMGAANYLRASGAPRDLRRALWAYNHSTLYVDAVLAYARAMKRDVRAFYGFHAWQVFVRTPTGYRRLTSP